MQKAIWGECDPQMVFLWEKKLFLILLSNKAVCCFCFRFSGSFGILFIAQILNGYPRSVTGLKPNDKFSFNPDIPGESALSVLSSILIRNMRSLQADIYGGLCA